MPSGNKADLLLRKIFELSEFAKRGDDFFSDEVCNFLVDEFNMDAAVLFLINPDKKLSVLSRSNSSRKIFTKGSIHECPGCKSIKGETGNDIFSDPSCQIKISDFLLNENCIILEVTKESRLLLKTAKKAALIRDEKENLGKTLNIISNFYNTWYSLKGGDLPGNKNFIQLYVDASQELKNSVNSIIGFTSIFADEKLSSSNTEYIASIKRNAQNLLLNINDLNEIARAESDQLVTNLKNISVENLVTDLTSIFKSKFASKNLTFKLNVAKGLEKPIDLDDQKLRYVLTNLLFFLTAPGPNGNIEITVSPETGNKLKFVISDNNKGIPADLVNNLFEPFALSKLNEFKNSSLAGFSLTLVKKYINFLGGEVNVTSDANGTTFTFNINGEEMTDLENTLSKLPKPTSKNKVLVIEDDYATSKLLSNYLNKWGYDPTIVNSEEQAFSVINTEQLLAVILDIEIPHINGLELLKKIHDNPNTKNVPVIACSIEPEQQKAFLMGAVEYFVKPINYNYLVEVLQHYKLRNDSNVLCVDDDVPTLNLVKQAIESVGFNAIADTSVQNDKIKRPTSHRKNP